jgi:hypothetical protein
MRAVCIRDKKRCGRRRGGARSKRPTGWRPNLSYFERSTEMTRSAWRRISTHLRNREYIEAYSIAFVAFGLAILSLVPDFVPDPLKWAAVLGGVGTLVLRITIPDTKTGSADELLNDRFAFDKTPFSERLEGASVIWIFAPTAINILSGHNCELMRSKVLSKPDGTVRIVILNPADSQAIELAVRQMDDSLDYPVQDFRDSLTATAGQLHAMSSWKVAGSFDYGFLDYNPGFSLVAVDPGTRHGRIIVEFHGFHNEGTSSRMHIELSRQQSERWYAYWVEQFNAIWKSASDGN